MCCLLAPCLPPYRHLPTAVWLFKSAVTGLNLFGYGIAFLAVCWYNYRKLQAMKEAASLAPVKSDAQLTEQTPLKRVDEEK